MTLDERRQRDRLRPALLAGGLFALVVLVVPLGALVRGQWGPLIRLDHRVEGAAHEDAVEHGIVPAVAKVVTHVGAPLLLELVTAAFVIWLLVRGHRRLAAYMAACVAGAYTLSTTGKMLVDRARPVFEDPISHARGASFPSGHATGSAAFYLALAVVLLSLLAWPRRGWLLLMAVVVPVAVAVTRVVLGVHYVSDVTAGLLIGWGWTAACTAFFTAWRAQEGRPVAPLEEGVEPEAAGVELET
ncbi:MAG: phosphatase PAP2 family protein [Frankiaceae bacterium]|nr:phosphatase PAP2 family protein [Frankiaceae bacterium]